MWFARWLVPLLVATVTMRVSSAASVTEPRCFPDDFLFGSATASYQVEGAWNEGGRTPSIWDDFCREQPGKQCADVADDFFHRYKDDIQLMLDTGLNSFRFSVSWSRAMNWDPSTQRMKPNAPGLAFYHALIDELRRQEIQPIITIYHWDLPRELQQELTPGGWLNSEIVGHFEEYAELMYHEFGQKIDMWSTFNEPLSFIEHGYGSGREAPGITGSAYVAGHNMLIAHARAVAKFRGLQEEDAVSKSARISIVLCYDMGYPLDPSNAADVAAAERKTEFSLGWFLTPIVTGDYPEIMRERAGEALPQFTEEEAAMLKGSYDLFMLNHYASKLVTDCSSPDSVVPCDTLSLGWGRDLGIDETRIPKDSRPSSSDEDGNALCPWFSGYPEGYRAMIRWAHAKDPSAEILLTENGWCGNATIENEDQLWYFQAYLEQVHLAMTEDKIPIIGYTAWSFLDNYEWGSFKPRFGLYYVNFTEHTGTTEEWKPEASELARIPRPAAKWYANLAQTKCLDPVPADSVPDEELAHGQTTRSQSSGVLSLLNNLFVYAVVAAVVLVAAVSIAVWRRRQTPPSPVATESSRLLQ